LAYGLNLRGLKEMMAERGIGADRSTIHRWVVRFSTAASLLPTGRDLASMSTKSWSSGSGCRRSGRDLDEQNPGWFPVKPSY